MNERLHTAILVKTKKIKYDDLMEKIIFDFIRQHHMIDKGTLVVAGVSGGADSMCLLALLLKYRKILDFDLLAVHVHHGIRGAEADRDETHVKNFCEAHKVSFCAVHIDVPARAKEQQLSLEEAGRKARKETFVRIAKEHLLQNGGEEDNYRIAVAHHQNDVAETVLFNLVRGSGIRGAAAMPPVLEHYIRPLLPVKREQIEEWLEKEGIEYVEDSTNKELEYTRNRMRNVVVPYLEENINAGTVHNLCNFATLMGDTLSYLEKQAEKELAHCTEEYDKIWKLTDAFDQEEPILKGMMVQNIFSRLIGSRKDVTNVQTNKVIDLFAANAGSILKLMGGIEGRRGYTGVYLYPVGTDIYGEKAILEAELGRLPLDCEPRVHFEVIPWSKKIKIPLNDCTKYFDYDKIKGNLCIRKRMPGDYLILSKEGGRKSLKSYLIDRKVPRDLRDRLTVVADGSHVLWVVGMRDSAGCPVTEESSRVMKVWLETE